MQESAFKMDIEHVYLVQSGEVVLSHSPIRLKNLICKYVVRLLELEITPHHRHPQQSTNPDNKAHGDMGPIWGRQDPGGPHVGPMNFANRQASLQALQVPKRDDKSSNTNRKKERQS